METYFKSEMGKKEIFELYDQKLAQLDITYLTKVVKTSYGYTNIIITGNSSNPPIILVHGSNGCAPIALETYKNVHKEYQVFAVDVIAQPNKSAETRPSMKDESYGKWMHEIIDTLALKNVTMAGFSFGGLIILKTLEYREERIKEVFLSAPAYIVNGNPLKLLFKVFIPMKRFIKTHNRKYVETFLSTLFTERDEFAVEYLSKVFQFFNIDFTPVPVINKNKAQLIKTPITLIAAKDDIMFPGVKMIKRAHKIFPSIKTTVLLENSKHVQRPSDNIKIEELILKKSI